MKITEIFFAVLDFELTGKPLSEDAINKLTPSVILNLTKIAAAHDLTQLFADALIKIDMLPADSLGNNLKKSIKIAIMRCERMKADIAEALNILNEAGIPFIRLKGARVREYYPSDWLRTSCDIDILVHEEMLGQALEAFEKSGWDVGKEKNVHDISVYSKSNTLLELHFTIKGGREDMDGVLDKVWDFSTLKEEGKYEYIQSNEYLVFYLTTHIAYHFLSAGCGVKYFLDLYILRDKLDFSEKLFDELCEAAGIYTLKKKIFDLLDVWFDGKEHDEVTKKMEKFILNGGTYGTETNRLKSTQVKDGGKAKNIKNRIFMPYDIIKGKYKILEKHKYLTPLFEVVRWIEMFIKGRFIKKLKELKSINNITDKEYSETEFLLNEMGLLK